ncbi:MAG: zinc ribbon domain-containing protein [Candidatus Vecturithrix sp.]|jgi:putative FmdB family regulatory protein|nr:zinc ribbon domain-containing protein [Candidatus Vecturithrix sp.]
MPIYEFYCEQCHTIYNFFSRKINTEKIPDCPKCRDTKLQRKVSLFAAISNRGDSGGDMEADMPPIDEAQMEKAMGMLAREAEHINEDDPRQAAQLMRKLSDATGLKMGAAMEEALSRMEHGEDPDKVEAEMGDVLEGEDPFVIEGKKGGKEAGQRPRPKVDETLYEL